MARTQRFIAAVDQRGNVPGTYDTRTREWVGHASTLTGARIKAVRLNDLNRRAS